MELNLKNIGIIEDAEVALDGLTVITGKNNSGKTTVGKALYYLSRANIDIDDAFKQSKEAFANAQLIRMSRVMFGKRRVADYSFKHIEKIDEQILYLLYTIRYGSLARFSGVSYQEFIAQTGKTLENLNRDEFMEFINDSGRGEESVNSETISEDSFEKNRKEALDIYSHAIDILNSDNSYIGFIVDRTKRFLNEGFNNQIKPIRNGSDDSVIQLKNNGDLNVKVVVHDKETVDVSYSMEEYPFNTALFIDDPFIIDDIDENKSGRLFFNRRAAGEDDINAVDITYHTEDLKDKLSRKANDNFFEEQLLQDRNRELFKKINSIVPGEFLQSGEGSFYMEDGYKLQVGNMATGSKLFFIIKLLLVYGYINEKTLLVLDEPESHLHPEWINRFAQILVLMTKELNARILLTTHSPNLMLALSIYSEEYGMGDRSHFYLAEKKEETWKARIRSVDDNISEAYGHLSIPLIEMSLRQKGKGKN